MTNVTLIDMEDDLKAERIALGRFIRECREDADPVITQAVAAGRADLTRQQWNRIEKGVSGTERPTLIRIAGALRLAPSSEKYDRLFRLAGFSTPENQTPLPSKRRPAPDESDPIADEDKQSRFERLKFLTGRLDGEDADKVLEYAELLAKKNANRDPRDEDFR